MQKFWLLLVGTWLLALPLKAQKDVYSFSNSLSYANYLVKTHQYQLAVEEWERIIFMAPENDSLKLELLRTLRLKQDFKSGVFKTETWFPQLPQVPRPFAIEYSRMLLLSGTYSKAGFFLDTNRNLLTEERQFFKLNRLLLAEDWEAAIDLYGKSPNLKAIDPGYQRLMDDLSHRKYKSAGLAMGLSMVVPGSGKLYTRDWQDALLSMLSIGTFAWQSYNGFRRDGTNSVYGWVFGGLGFGFYSGNVYGSYKAARKYNHDLDHRYQKQSMDLFVRSMAADR